MTIMYKTDVVQGHGVPIKSWTEGVPFEEQAKTQLRYLSMLPIVWPHVAVMPDVHLGIGATVGSVVPTRRAIIPAAVGVDIGCGMMAVRTNLTSHDVSDNAKELFTEISDAVPHGGAKGKELGNWGEIPSHVAERYKNELEPELRRIIGRHGKVSSRNAHTQLGTLGGGNHFIEICLDEEDRVWFMLHSGSRGIGNKIGTYFIELAKDDMDRLHRQLPLRDLAYIEEGSTHFNDYVDALHWAQEYARINREIMMDNLVAGVKRRVKKVKLTDEAVNCHHNYVSKETHFGEELYVTRKGAVSARAGQLGIIPGSMGAKSFIVRGKGNPDAFCSCSHGAGRSMSRGAAKSQITLAMHREATQGVECLKDKSVIDESPAAYKDIDAVMSAQKDLVDIVHTLKQIVCVKG